MGNCPYINHEHARHSSLSEANSFLPRERLQACGVEVELLTFEGAGHGFRGAEADQAQAATMAFFAKHLGAK